MKLLTKRAWFALTMAACTMVAHAADTPATANDIDGKTEVAYTCKIEVNGKLTAQKVTAMYGLKGKDIVVAQLKIGDQITPGMWRDSFVPMNRFISQDDNAPMTVWTAMPADADNVTKVDGGKLSVSQAKNAQQSIILDACQLDRAATAKLNQ